jgi:thioredoxin 1
LRPVVSKVAEEVTSVDFYYVDTDQSPELAQKFGVMGIPVLVKLKNGQEVDRSVGFTPEDAVKAFALS